MNRLRNYKKLSDTKRDSEQAKEDLYATLARYEVELKEKMLENILHTYRNAIMEIERRKLAERAGLSPPRIEHFVHTIFDYSFKKLHKGDKLKAFDIMINLKNEFIKIVN